MTEPATVVHLAARAGAPAAACGAALHTEGATYRTFPDDGVTCPDCRNAFPAPDPLA